MKVIHLPSPFLPGTIPHLDRETYSTKDFVCRCWGRTTRFPSSFPFPPFAPPHPPSVRLSLWNSRSNPKNVKWMNRKTHESHWKTVSPTTTGPVETVCRLLVSPPKVGVLGPFKVFWQTSPPYRLIFDTVVELFGEVKRLRTSSLSTGVTRFQGQGRDNKRLTYLHPFRESKTPRVKKRWFVLIILSTL